MEAATPYQIGDCLEEEEENLNQTIFLCCIMLILSEYEFTFRSFY